jgi:hypothetical protein
VTRKPRQGGNRDRRSQVLVDKQRANQVARVQ